MISLRSLAAITRDIALGLRQLVRQQRAQREMNASTLEYLTDEPVPYELTSETPIFDQVRWDAVERAADERTNLVGDGDLLLFELEFRLRGEDA